MESCSLCNKRIDTKNDSHSYNYNEGNYHCSDCLSLDDENTNFYLLSSDEILILRNEQKDK